MATRRSVAVGSPSVAINALTHEPLDGVHVTIYGLRANAPPVESYGAISGNDGHFSIVRMRPGKYGFAAKHNGFFHAEKPNTAPATRQIVLMAGDRKTEFIIEMTPEAVITGRVVDEYGDPVQDVFVGGVPVPPTDPDPFILQG